MGFPVFDIIDPVIISKLDKLTVQLSEIEKKISTNIWIPIITAIVSVITLLLTQWIDRLRKRMTDERKELRELMEKCELRLTNIQCTLKLISQHKNLSKYYWRAYLVEYNNKESQKKSGKPEDTENKEAQKHLEAHRRHADLVLVTRTKLDELLADCYASFSRYILLAKAPESLDEIFTLIQTYQLDDAEYLDDSTKNEVAIEKCHQNIETLTGIYRRMFEPLMTFRTQLKKHL